MHLIFRVKIQQIIQQRILLILYKRWSFFSFFCVFFFWKLFYATSLNKVLNICCGWVLEFQLKPNIKCIHTTPRHSERSHQPTMCVLAKKVKQSKTKKRKTPTNYTILRVAKTNQTCVTTINYKLNEYIKQIMIDFHSFANNKQIWASHHLLPLYLYLSISRSIVLTIAKRIVSKFVKRCFC